VRELENTIERAVILSRSNEITIDDLWLPSMDLLGADPRTAPAVEAGSHSHIEDAHFKLPLSEFVEEMTKRRVIAALDATGWKKLEAADALGVDRATLYRMIKKFEIG
jgi:DNA-binding NtrC family response regulator